MKTFKVIVLVGFACSIVGCSKSSDSGAPKIPEVPVSLDFAKPQVGEKLTRNQVAKIRAVFADRPIMQLPPGELIFVNEEETTPEERARMEEKLQATDKNSYSMLQEIRSACQVFQDPPQMTNSFPMDDQGSIIVDQIQSGQGLAVDVNRGISSKPWNNQDCPGTLSDRMRILLTVIDIQQPQKTGTATAKMAYSNKTQVVKDKYSKLLKSKGLIVDSAISGLVARKSATSDVHLQFSVQGGYHLLSQTIPYQMQNEILFRNIPNEEKAAQAQTLIQMSLRTQFSVSGVAVDLAVFSQQLANGDPNAKPNFQIFVNGHPMSQEEFEELFGEDNPALKLSPKMTELVKIY